MYKIDCFSAVAPGEGDAIGVHCLDYLDPCSLWLYYLHPRRVVRERSVEQGLWMLSSLDKQSQLSKVSTLRGSRRMATVSPKP